MPIKIKTGICYCYAWQTFSPSPWCGRAPFPRREAPRWGCGLGPGSQRKPEPRLWFAEMITTQSTASSANLTVAEVTCRAVSSRTSTVGLEFTVAAAARCKWSLQKLCLDQMKPAMIWMNENESARSLRARFEWKIHKCSFVACS